MSHAHFYVKQQLSVKEFYLKIIPWRLFTFRVCPGTKVNKASIRETRRMGPLSQLVTSCLRSPALFSVYLLWS